MSSIYPSERPFRENTFAIFVPIFCRPPSGAREMNISKFLKCDKDFTIQKLFHEKMLMQKCPLTRQTAVKFR